MASVPRSGRGGRPFESDHPDRKGRNRIPAFSASCSAPNRKNRKTGSPDGLPVFYQSNLRLVPVLGRDSELLAPVCAACSEYAAAVRSAHTLAETVLVDTLAIGGLECSFHIFCF